MVLGLDTAAEPARVPAVLANRRPAAGPETTCRRPSLILCFLLAPLLGPAAALPVRAAPPPRYETVVAAPPTPPDRPREDPSASASVITADRAARSAETLPQLLSELPGVVITRHGSLGSLATVSLRGSSPNQVAVYADGVPLDSAVTGSLDLGLVPLTAVQRIEVYRGASPLAHGTSAMGGTLSLTSEAPSRSRLAAHSGLGSYATRLGGLELARVDPGRSLVARVAVLDTAADFPYRSDNRTLFDPSDDRTLRRQNNQLRQLDGAARADWTLPRGRHLWLSLSVLSRRQGLAARSSDASFAASLQRRRLAASAGYTSGSPGAGGQLRGTGYLLLGEQRLSDRLGEVAFVATETRDRSLTAGATVLGVRPLATWFLLSAMVDGRHEAFRPREEIRADRRPPGARQRVAAALAGTAHVPTLALDVIATVRGEAARDELSPGSLFGGSGGPPPAPAVQLLPIARLGLVSTPHPALRLRANLGSYARLPTLFERYGNGGLIQGNPALDPERGYSADLGLTGELAGAGGRLRLDAALFAATARDLIHFEQMGYFASYLNVAASRSAGLELAATGSLGRWARVTAQVTALDVRDRSGQSGRDGRQLPHQPRIRAYLRPELRDLPLGPTWRGDSTRTPS